MKKFLIILVVGVLGLMLLMCGGFGLLVYRAGNQPTEAKSPAEHAFDAANSQIGAFRGDVAFGNSETAKLLADDYAKLLKSTTEIAFTGGKKNSKNLAQDNVIVYCHLTDDTAVFLVNVPQLKRYKDDVRDTLAMFAWTTARATLDKHARPRKTVAVALRGDLLYGPVMKGSSDDDEPKMKGSGSTVLKNQIKPLFEPATTQPSTQP